MVAVRAEAREVERAVVEMAAGGAVATAAVARVVDAAAARAVEDSAAGTVVGRVAPLCSR